MTKSRLLVSALLLILLLAACAPSVVPAPAPAPAAPAPVTAPAPARAVPVAPAKAGWEVEWEKTIQAAKREGKVIAVTSNFGPELVKLRQALSDRFGISIEYITARAVDASQRVLTERRAGIYSYDINFLGTASVLTLFKPRGILEKLDPILFLPEVIDPKSWREGKIPWADADHVIFGSMGFVAPPLLINTDLVRPEEVQSLRDLLNSKWKGKIVSDDPTITGVGATVWSVIGAKLMDWDFVRDFVTKQEPHVFRDYRLAIEWVARGKMPIAVAYEQKRAEELIQLGAPMKAFVPKEGAYVSSTGGDVSVYTKAPHPNAAKLFINWFLTKEGQSTLVSGLHLPSQRSDVSIEGIDPIRIPQPGTNYVWINREAWVMEVDPYKQKVTEIFKLIVK